MKTNWFHLILRHLYENYSPEYVEMNDFLMYKIGISSTSLTDIKKADRVFQSLSNKQYIQYTKNAKGENRTIKDSVSNLGEDFSTTNPTRIPGNLENISLKARITIDGLTFISNELREDRIEKLSRSSKRIVIASVIISMITLAKEIWLSPPVINKQTRQTLQKQEKSLHNIQQSLYRIDSTFRVVADSLKS